ncbi:MAG: DedA family protein, partial [Actinomycetota bacterium]|nr:DedA family protein [Actinomycetota bacterium]
MTQMDAPVHAVIDTLRGLGPWPVYAIVLGLGFSSSALALDIVLPGEVGLLLAGWVASEGRATFLGVFLAGALGATAGDSFSYWIGRRWGKPLMDRWGPVRRRLEPQIARAEGFYERHGGKALFAGRWIGALRSVMAFVAGVARMRFGRFLAWNVVASLAWSAAVVAVGYFLGRFIVAAFRQAALVITLGAVSLLVLGLATQWIRRHRDRVPDGVVRLTPPASVAVGVGAAVIATVLIVLV